MSNSFKPIIAVLDYPTAAQALAFSDRLDPTLCRVKVGKELFTAAGPMVVEGLVTRGFDVFLDLKFHDIPNTVAGACRAATNLGVWMLNVHASGGRAMLEAAKNAVDSVSSGVKKPQLIGVTVLTSMADADLPAVGLAPDCNAQVLRLAALTAACGLDGVVCSAMEAEQLKAAHGKNFKLITPGIRLAGDAKGDQQRVVTPVEAMQLGADYLVIGRSINAAADPIAVLKAIQADIEKFRSVN
jgi:orotidine-5'-phosphate decarboxylase